MYVAFIFLLILTTNCEKTGRTYFFRFNRSSNAYKVHNRLYYLNHNITDYDYSNYNQQYHHRKASEYKETTEKSFQEKNFTNFFLDPEWNFNHSEINKSRNFPLFINKFYESKLNDTTKKHTLRFLFNNNVNSTNGIIKFNLRSLKPNETIVDAEMYVYLQKWKNYDNVTEKSIVIRVYQFEHHVNGSFNETVLIENPDIHKLFNVVYVSKARKGWQTFKIRKPLENWLKGELNLGLLITISSFDENKLISIFNDTNEGILRTFAVVKTQENINEFSNVTLTSSSESPSNCIKHQMYIDFKKIAWDNFIISPDGISTFDCIGKCNSNENGTINHVKLLSISNHRIPCCVPTEYSSIPIQFYDKFNNIVIKNYENVVPTKCGCR